MKRAFYSITIVALMFISCTHKVGLVPQPLPVASAVTVMPCDSTKYSKDVQPILNANCTSCHGAGYPLGDFTNYVGTIVKVNDLTFKYRVVTAHDMPSPNGLNQTDIDKIKCWLDNGAKNN